MPVPVFAARSMPDLPADDATALPAESSAADRAADAPSAAALAVSEHDLGDTPMLEARNLKKEYDNGDVQALKGINLSVPRGQFIAIMGPSGSGKSTLLNCLSTLDAPSSGQVMIKGVDVAKVRKLNVLRAETIGFIFQLHNLIPSLSLLDNVMIPMAALKLPSDEKRARATRALEHVGLAHRIKHVPTKVSGGERQRAAFARALVNEPEIILGDEPTGNVDSKTGAKLMGLLNRFRSEQKTTLVIVTHNPELAAEADRCITILDGELHEGLPDYDTTRITRKISDHND